jgi:hypothetical protein
MFNKTTIETAATSLVGFREDTNAIYATLTAAQKASTSGLYVNDLPGVTFEIISANLSEDATDAATYLSDVYNAALLSLVNQFSERSKDKYNSRELLDKTNIVSGVASFGNLVTQNERFVGYWLRPHHSDYMNVQITHLGFQANVLQNPIKVYLYETSQLEALKTFDFNLTKNFSLVWAEVTDWILQHESETGGTGQDYLLGYYEKDTDNAQAFQLQGKALSMEFDCGCPGSPKTKYGRYCGVEPIEIGNSYLNWSGTQYDIPLVDNVLDFTVSRTHGLVAKINVTCDITDVISQNIDIFARSLQHAIATKILYDAYASNRINSISDSQKEQSKQFAVKYDGVLNGYNTPDGDRVKGLVDGLTMDFSTLDDYCLPCKRGFEKHSLVR